MIRNQKSIKMWLKKSFILILILFFSCKKEDTLLSLNHKKIQLKWNKAYNDDSIDKSIIGLKWTLSYLGATLPKDENGVLIDEKTITLEVNKIGFNTIALNKITELHNIIFKTEEYKKNKNIDLGRYICLLLGSSEHYYEIVGTPKKLDDVLKKYKLLPKKGYVNNSDVSLEHRIIQFSKQENFNQLFFCKEIDSITQKVYEFETIELLPNGQLRFGIFDEKGNRKTSANNKHTNAGKPAKCMWCHESIINQLYSKQNDFKGYLTASQLQNKLVGYRNSNQNLKISLTDGVDFKQTQQHTLAELLYISFMEPSAERLALEWNISKKQVQDKLKNFKTHNHHEFDFLRNLYRRNEIEHLSPVKNLPVSGDVREGGNQEVNYLQ